jgi:hypothetical protein
MARLAHVFTAHDYAEGVALCGCPDAEEHAPCLDCGSGRDAFIHSEEGRLTGVLLTVVAAEDSGKAAEESQ